MVVFALISPVRAVLGVVSEWCADFANGLLLKSKDDQKVSRRVENRCFTLFQRLILHVTSIM